MCKCVKASAVNLERELFFYISDEYPHSSNNWNCAYNFEFSINGCRDSDIVVMEPIYLNVVLLNKEEVVKAKVTAKTGGGTNHPVDSTTFMPSLNLRLCNF